MSVRVVPGKEPSHKCKQTMAARYDLDTEDIRKIFKQLSDEEKGSRRSSFSLDFVESLMNKDGAEQEESGNVSNELESLRKVCKELISSARKSHKVIDSMENDGKVMKKKIQELEVEAQVARKEVKELREKLERQDKILQAVLDRMEENKKELELNVKKAEECVETKYNEVVKMSKGMEEEKNKWSKMNTRVKEVFNSHEEQVVKMTEIIDEQKKQKVEMEKKVKGMVKGELQANVEMIREECERAKSIVISGIVEPDIESIVKRQDHVTRKVQEIFESIKDSEDKWMEDVLEVRRLGKYDGTKKGLNKRPVKVRFNTERTAREVIAMARKLRKIEGMENVYINKDLSLAERTNEHELRMKAREQNETRTEEEERKHFFVVRRGKVIKLFKTREEEGIAVSLSV